MPRTQAYLVSRHFTFFGPIILLSDINHGSGYSACNILVLNLIQTTFLCVATACGGAISTNFIPQFY